MSMSWVNLPESPVLESLQGVSVCECVCVRVFDTIQSSGGCHLDVV